MVPRRAGDQVDDLDRDSGRRRFGDGIVPDIIKRVVDAGVGKLSEQPENLRHFVQELRVPKEVGAYLVSQIDETKNGLYRAVANEIRSFLEQTNIADELTRALTKLSFEIRMSVRFTPNEDGAFPKPKLKSQMTVKENENAEGDCAGGKKPSHRASRNTKQNTA